MSRPNEPTDFNRKLLGKEFFSRTCREILPSQSIVPKRLLGKECAGLLNREKGEGYEKQDCHRSLNLSQLERNRITDSQGSCAKSHNLNSTIDRQTDSELQNVYFTTGKQKAKKEFSIDHSGMIHVITEIGSWNKMSQFPC